MGFSKEALFQTLRRLELKQATRELEATNKVELGHRELDSPCGAMQPE
jgi:hypothetical protein